MLMYLLPIPNCTKFATGLHVSQYQNIVDNQ